MFPGGATRTRQPFSCFGFCTDPRVIVGQTSATNPASDGGSLGSVVSTRLGSVSAVFHIAHAAVLPANISQMNRSILNAATERSLS